MIGFVHAFLGLLSFLVGAAAGSFMNVCIYRLPWQKSVIWPGSRCMSCLEPIASHDNWPIVSWLALRGECRNCGAKYSGRYAMVELFTGLLFLSVYLVDVALPESLMFTPPLHAFATMGYHLVFVMLLVIAGLIDFDLFIIPDSVTVPGMVFALVIGALAPWVRQVPAQASTMLGGLGVGLLGLAVGAGIIVVIRFLGTLAFGREAMGLGDATMLGMIGAFLGWQAVVLDLVLAAFLGLVPALIKIVLNLLKRLAGRQLSSTDREIPFGPFLSLAALVLVLVWPWLWPGWARGFFSNLRDAYLLLTGQGLGP